MKWMISILIFNLSLHFISKCVLTIYDCIVYNMKSIIHSVFPYFLLIVCIFFIYCLAYNFYNTVQREPFNTNDETIIQQLRKLKDDSQKLYDEMNTTNTQSKEDINRLTALKTEIQTLHDKVEANAQQTQDDRKYIEKAVDRVIEKLNNA